VKRIRIEFTVHEKRPHQAETTVTREPTKVEIDEDQLVAELGRLLDRAALAYQRDRRHLSMKWRPIRLLGGEWRAFS
jgi:hypothetical protein